MLKRIKKLLGIDTERIYIHHQNEEDESYFGPFKRHEMDTVYHSGYAELMKSDGILTIIRLKDSQAEALEHENHIYDAAWWKSQ